VDAAPRGLQLDALDREGCPQPFLLSTGGVIIELRSAQDIAWADLLAAGHNPHAFILVTASGGDRDILAAQPLWKVQRVITEYRRHSGLCTNPDDDRRLASLVQTYGKAIEYDLWRHGKGEDLAVLWRTRRWRKLLNLIDQLPRDTAYMEAVADDEQLATFLLSRPDGHSKKPSAPTRRLSEYSAEVEVLSAILDRLGEVTQAIVASAGAKPRKVTPAPRPVTALERMRTRRALTKHRSLVSRVLPGGGDPPPRQAPPPPPSPPRPPAAGPRGNTSSWGSI
jgi:hypothetical protein